MEFWKPPRGAPKPCPRGAGKGRPRHDSRRGHCAWIRRGRPPSDPWPRPESSRVDYGNAEPAPLQSNAVQRMSPWWNHMSSPAGFSPDSARSQGALSPVVQGLRNCTRSAFNCASLSPTPRRRRPDRIGHIVPPHPVAAAQDHHQGQSAVVAAPGRGNWQRGESIFFIFGTGQADRSPLREIFLRAASSTSRHGTFGNVRP